MTTEAGLQFHLGGAQVVGALAAYPIFGGEPRLRYQSLAQAVQAGVIVSEVDEQGSINDVLVRNGSDEPVLLYEGELISGARQSREIDGPVLVPADVELRVPVSCVERGRWDHAKRAEHFAPAPYAADPELRAASRAEANRRSAAEAPSRPTQQAVWHGVSEVLCCYAMESPTDALTDLYDAKRPALEDLTRRIEALDGQVGVVVELSGRPIGLDLISRSEVFADLLPRLAHGYALHALGRGGRSLHGLDDILIEELELGVRAYSVLKRAGIHTLDHLVSKTESELAAMQNVGRRTIDELTAMLHTRGLSLRAAYGTRPVAADDRLPDRVAADAYLGAVLGSPRRPLPTTGMGGAFALTGAGIEGCELTVEGELVALSAFPANDG